MTHDATAPATTADDLHPGSIAIVGMAVRVPDAADIATFWQNLLAGHESIRDLSLDELDDDFDAATRAGHSYVRRRPILDGIENFDAAYFNMSPREAALTDPQQRIFLQCAVSALEDAAIDPARAKGAIGVFAGSALNTYFLRHVLGREAAIRAFTSDFQVGHYPELLGAMPDFIATRTAYKLDLKGPAVTVQSACSTSLLAVAQACQSLQLYQCDAALAGGVSVSVPQHRGYESLDGGMVSADGRVRPFDAAANGTVFGSGCGVVVLKRLEDAIAAGDPIYAVIRGIGVNNDGGDKVGFTAPSVSGQTDAIRLAHANAGIAPRDIGYIEAHGTATPLGDPIEVRAATEAFAGSNATPRSCVLGSVKANVGHLDAAAGVVGLIKTALILHHETLPPQINYTTPNPAIDFASGPFRIASARQAWPRAARPRMAGVSAFGVGGTNVHLVLQEAPAQPAIAAPNDDAVIIPLSAKSPAALSRLAARLADVLQGPDAPRLADISKTLIDGRRALPYRVGLVANNPADAHRQLAAAATITQPAAPVTSKKIVFMFPGQGSQYPGMASSLYARDATVRHWIDRGAECAKPVLGLDIRPLLFDTAVGDDDAPHALRDTTLAQPALYIVEHALAKCLVQNGCTPHAMIGHSLGEFVAATLAGVFSFEDGLRLVVERGRAMQALPGGAMAAVRGSRADVESALVPGVEIAAINAPQLITVAGTYDAVSVFEQRAEAAGLIARRLHTSHAFHSTMIEPAVAGLEAICRTVQFSAPTVPFVSAVTGTWITTEDATSPAYWARHARAPVLFADALATLATHGPSQFVEVGPGRTLSTFARQSAAGIAAASIIPTQPEVADRVDDTRLFLNALAQLWAAGAPVQLPTPVVARRIALPTYSFEPTRHWIDLPIAQPVPTRPVASNLPQSLFVPPDPVSKEAPMLDHKARLTRDIVGILEELSGAPIDRASQTLSFLELGFDSLSLGQVAQRIHKQLGAKIGFRQLLSDVPTIAALVDHCAPIVQPTATPSPTPVATASPSPAVTRPLERSPVAPPSDGSTDALMREQLATLERVIALQLQTRQTPAALARIANDSVHATPTAQSKPVPLSAATDDAIGGERFKMFAPRSRAAATSTGLTTQQQQLISSLIARSDRKFASSKADTQSTRAVQADPRSASGFRAEWKDLVYPLVVTRSAGAKLWDADGNEFVDLVNGFGQTMFGHAPAFVTDAIKAQLDKGFAIGPQTPLAGEVATELASMLGHQRVAFCNTGSEAVMAAMRIARAVSGRSKIVFFGGDYHGQFDEVLAKGLSRRAPAPGAQPAAAGIPSESVSNIVVLAYDAPESLDYIRAHAHELAAVLVEPVQSRHPALFPERFLRDLRQLTTDQDIALIFDEVVTGFRVHQQGVQGLLGFTADIATYGKVLGGGMPLGILAGSAKYLDALDGGQWQFGDASVPEVAPTFFAGTFVRHPLTMAAAKAVIAHLNAAGPSLQTTLSATTKALVSDLNALFAQRGIKSRAEVFSSFFYVNCAAEDPLASLLYPLLRLEGLHIAESFPCFLTTAHGAADLAHIVAAFDRALAALQGVSILPAAADANLPDTIPPTAAQHEIYRAAQLDDRASCAFNEQVTLTFDGSVDAAQLAAALDDLVARHDALRASFGPTGEHMTIARTRAVTMAVRDLSSDRAPDQALNAALVVSARTPFDLAHGPLLRATLFKQATTQHVLALTAHHIVCDGWSFNVLASELAELYAARMQSRAPALEPLLSFRDFARADAAAATSETRAFWADLYRVVPEPLDLPLDRARSEQRTWAGATATGHIEADIVSAFKKSLGRSGVTLFSGLFAGLQLVLGRLGNTDDVVLTVPMAGQSKLDGQSMVGHAVNFLPLRAAIDQSGSFSSHLKKVAAHLNAALAHQDYTLGSLVTDLGLKRDIGRTPLSDVQFNLERLPEPIEVPGARMTMAPASKAAVNFDLFFNMIESRDGLRIDVDYNTDILDAATIARWIGHLRTVIAAVTSAPETPMAQVDLLDADQRADLLQDFSATARPFDRSASVHELIAQQARLTPAARAVACGSTALTYAELDAAANRLAHYLSRTVLGPGGRIAVAVDRSTDMLVSLLAVMKAGHAYVPLDPTHPPARLAATLAMARASALIVADSASASWAPTATRVLALQSAYAEIARMPATPLGVSSAAQGDMPAYVIFTSGSTGTPKGVEVPHRAVVNFLLSMADEPGFTADDHLLAVTTICFDIAGLELFLPLVTGGSLTIATREDVQDGFAVVDMLRTSRATVMQATPSLWRMLLEAGFVPRQNLKMLCGGEPLPRDLADQLNRNDAPLWNLYGPTETTIWSAAGRVGAGAVDIGNAIANTQLVILDADDRLIPIGVTGELNIGGAGLAHGYFDAPDLTTAAFRDVALAPGRRSRLYRTGDLARRLADGRIVLLGRRDQQIKLRGYRIELEEIEAVLRAVPGVAAAAVAVRGDAQDAQLIAFVVTRDGESLQSKAIQARVAQATKDHVAQATRDRVAQATRERVAQATRDHVASKLPAYMVPARFVSIDALPMTGNGKLDRKTLATLPIPHSDAFVDKAADKSATKPTLVALAPAPALATPAATAMHQRIRAVWCDVLGLTDVATDTRILDLGADSLHLFRIAARLHAMDLPLQARDLLRHPTIAEQARLAESRLALSTPGDAAPSDVDAFAPPSLSLSAYRSGARRNRPVRP